jgi:type 2 lantibiotic biosynthesis protein LanM
LFLGALWRGTGYEEYRQYALGALHGLRQRIQYGYLDGFLKVGIGGASGLGSLIYALTRCAEFLDETDLQSEALNLAGLISQEVVKNDDHLDVIAGSAGAILGLLPLYQATHSEDVLASADASGQHLLEKQVEADPGGSAWPTLDGKLLSGFSHGAAGIAYALLKLYQVSGDESFLIAAQKGIAYEQGIYDAGASNWPDLRIQGIFMTSWCHGAPGIALARLGSLSVIDNEAIRSDINNGLSTTLKFVRDPAKGQRDHLCCGHFGRADILLAAGQMLGIDEYTQAALNLASARIEQAHKNGDYCLLRGLPRDLPQPGFFNGLAGIGYTCLRFSQLDDPLPSALLWE